jgi:hypothetical protein
MHTGRGLGESPRVSTEWTPEDEAHLRELSRADHNGELFYINRLARLVLGQRGQINELRAQLEYADHILRFAAGVPCLSDLLGEESPSECECYGCAGRKYAALASQPPSQQSLPHVSPTTEPE